MEIFKLFGSILINTDDADKSLAKTDKSAKGIASTLGNGVKAAAKFGAAIGTAAVSAAGGMYKMATSAASVADDVDKMSQKIGVSREAYQELSFALSQSGTDVSKLQAGLKTLSAQAEKGNDYFQQLGISLTDVNGNAKTQEQLFFDVTNALQKMEAGTEKTTIATTLLGKSGTELMPLFNGAAGSLDEMRQQAHDLGLVLEDDVINNGVNLTDALDQMKRSLSSVMTQLGGRLMPIVEQAADFITANIPKINEMIGQLAPIFEQAFSQIMPVLMDLAASVLPSLMSVVSALLPPISDIFSALAPIISSLIQKLVPVVVKIVEKLLPPLVRLIEKLLPILDIVLTILDPILDLLLVLIDPIADILNMLSPIIELGLEIIKAVLEPIMPLIKTTADILGNVLGGAVSEVAKLVSEGLLPIIQGLIDFLNGDFQGGAEKAGEGLLNAFSGAFGLIDSLLGTNLQQWYQELINFGNSVGAALEDAFNKKQKLENQNTYDASDIRSDIVYASNAYMRQGMSAADALARAKSDVLTDADKQALFDQYLAADLTDEEAEKRRQMIAGSVPHLASGGVVYGKTLAVVGDNQNVRNDPEIVAPLSQLSGAVGFDRLENLLTQILAVLQDSSDAPAPEIVMDSQRVATIVTNRINRMRYVKGAEVVY